MLYDVSVYPTSLMLLCPNNNRNAQAALDTLWITNRILNAYM